MSWLKNILAAIWAAFPPAPPPVNPGAAPPRNYPPGNRATRARCRAGAGVLLVVLLMGCATLQSLLDRLHPAPPPAPPPVVAPIAVDEIDPALVTWGEPAAGNVGAWPITAAITGGKINSDGMQFNSIAFTNTWPVIPGPDNPKESIGNWWIVARVDGQWHAATADWLGKGKSRAVGKHWKAGQDGLHGALAGWTGQPGEEVGMMVSTPARAGVQTIKERSQIVRGRMP